MRSRVYHYVTVGSIRQSACLYVPSDRSAPSCGGFTAVSSAAKRYRLIAARLAVSSSCAAAATCGGKLGAVPRCQLT